MSRAGVFLLVGGAWGQGVVGIEPVNWWVESVPGVSGYMAQGVPERVLSCW